jgi:hypothetical protein
VSFGKRPPVHQADVAHSDDQDAHGPALLSLPGIKAQQRRKGAGIRIRPLFRLMPGDGIRFHPRIRIGYASTFFPAIRPKIRALPKAVPVM